MRQDVVGGHQEREVGWSGGLARVWVLVVVLVVQCRMAYRIVNSDTSWPTYNTTDDQPKEGRCETNFSVLFLLARSGRVLGQQRQREDRPTRCCCCRCVPANRAA
jgi:hypothetical protein